MKYLFLPLLISLTLGCKGMSVSDDLASLGQLDSSTYNFAGTWLGTLLFTELDTSTKTNCASEVKITQPPNSFVIEYGTFVCGAQTESWPRTVLTISNGKLYLGTDEVGKITFEKVSFSYVTVDTVLLIQVLPQTSTVIQLRVTYLDPGTMQPFALLEGLLNRQ